MTQATVNVGNNAVKNLNPNAQHFSSSDFNNGTVLAGPTVPSDDSYADYIDNGTGSYLQQHQSHIYPVDPSSIDTLQQQQQQQQQQSESNFAAHEHAAMLDTIDHQQTSLINPNHLHHPQSHMHQTMPDEEQAQQLQLLPEQLRQHLKKQLEYYFSRENMVNDRYLKSQMDAEEYVPIAVIANFKLVKRLTHDLQLIIDVLKELPSVEVDPEERKVRSTDDKKYPPTRKRCIIILRDVPNDATDNEVSDLFLNEYCPVPAVACERALESSSECWYVTFNSEDDAQNAFLYLTRENVSIRGKKVLARMKARLWQKPSSVPSTHPTTPVSPPITPNNGGATSPPPLPVQQQQPPQPMQTYQNSTFVPQQQQAPPQPPPPQYSSHSQQQQFNQQQIPQQQQQQQQHAPAYMQATANAHPNQASILGNLQAQANNYRYPMHSSVAPPPPQHVAAQFSTTNQTQHPTSLDHAQVLQQHLRMTYPNYGANTPFDRATWAAAHQQSVQAGQPTLSFATPAQQANMASYSTSIHQQPQFITANHPVFPGNLWYMPSAYQTAEPYPTMAYNGTNKTKPRMNRDYPLPPKSRNSTKPPGARNSRHEGLQMSNEHSNELLDYCQHSTPHSEGSSSPVPRAEAVINRTNEPIVQPVSNTSLQHVQTYPTNIIDTSANDNVDHYHQHQSTNDVLYNNTNSHIQQQGLSDTNSSQEQTNESQNLGKFSNQSSYPTPTSTENSKLNYQPLEQRKPPLTNQDQQQHPSINENQQQQSNKKANSQQASIRPLMPRENRSTQNSNRPSTSSQQGRPQQQQQQQIRMNSNSSTPLTVTIPKVSSATYYNQTSSSSPQSPNSNQKTQQQQQPNDNNGPRTYADMLKVKQIPQQQQTESTKSPTNETNDLSSSRAESPINNNSTNPKTDSVSVTAETNGPLSSSSSDVSPSNQIEPAIPSQSSTINDSNPARRNSSASDHPQQQQQQQQHSSSPSHQQYNNSRGRGRGGGGGAYRYSNNNERRSGSNNSLNRGGGGGRGGGRRPVNNNAGSNGPSAYQPRGNGGRGNGRFFDRPRGGGGGNYHNSNQTVHRFTGNTGNVEPQVHYVE